jgi:hypothetical protein
MDSFEQSVVEFGSRANGLLRTLGLPAPNKPSKEILFPEDLGSIHSDDLGVHLSYWASICAYGHQKVAVLEGALVLAREQAEAEYDVRLFAKSSTQKITERRAHVSATKAVRSLRSRVATIEADLKVLKSVILGYDLKNAAISREITRRQQERLLRDG